MREGLTLKIYMISLLKQNLEILFTIVRKLYLAQIVANTFLLIIEYLIINSWYGLIIPNILDIPTA